MTRFYIIIMVVGIFSPVACAMESDPEVLKTHQANIATMVDAAYSMPRWQQNNAAAAYVREHKKSFDQVQKPQRGQDIFDQETCKHVLNHFTTVENDPTVQKTFAAFKATITSSRTCDEGKAQQFRGAAARATMAELQKFGVNPAVTQGNTPTGHLGFLQANKDITPEAEKHMFAGSFLLAYFPSMQRKAMEDHDQGSREAKK